MEMSDSASITSLVEPRFGHQQEKMVRYAGVSVPLGLPSLPWPEDNPYSASRAELGKILFFDSRLSANAISCASCHEPSHAFSGSTAFSKGANGKLDDRHTPTIINRAWGKSQLWDGRLPTLESQILNAVTNPNEMGTTTERVVQTLRGIKGYAPLFTAAFGDGGRHDHLQSRCAGNRYLRAHAPIGKLCLRSLLGWRQVGSDETPEGRFGFLQSQGRMCRMPHRTELHH
jgi:cytochrome c peroxidase